MASAGAGANKGNGLTLEITGGITEHANRVALKGVFSAFGDVLACWVPPIDRRGVDNASVRFAQAQAADSAKQACDAGQVFFQGLPLKVKWRTGGGPRVGNSDIGGSVGGNSPTRPRGEKRSRSPGSRMLTAGPSRRGRDRSRSRSRNRDRRRRSRSRRKRSRSRENKFAETGGGMDQTFDPLAPPQGLEFPGGMPPSFAGMPPGAMPPLQDNVFSSVGAPAMPTLPDIPAEPPRDLEAEAAAARRKKEEKEKRAAQLKRGPGVAALVQGALKRAQTAVVKKKDEEKDDNVENIDKDDEDDKPRKNHEDKKAKKEKKAEKSKEELEEERKRKEQEEEEERERLEREALEREREKARRAAEEAAREEQRLKEEAANREARVRAGVEAAKKQQAEREKREAAKHFPSGKYGPDNLYGDMPDVGMDTEDLEKEARRKEVLRAQKANLGLPPEDRSKIVFLDIDGVLRPARAGGFDILAADGTMPSNADTSDFFPSAMQALRHIVERTGAIIVLSSEWRRSEALRDAVDEVLEANRLRPIYSVTPVDSDKLSSGGDPVRSFSERRAREVSNWLRVHEEDVKGWVVLDDINLAIADEDKKAGKGNLGPKLVQTWPLCGLTMGNAKTAVRILNGEMIHKVLVERPKAPGGMNTGGGAAASGTSTPVPGVRV
mmetsp:Transcript_88317/g.152915  ORF Transcript_88317/g.152915 Transcript_88317/m.152915 type:complete len:665 (-) Transcript_88317:47-2041(-)